MAFSEACTNLIGSAPAPDDEEPRPLMLQAWVEDDELGVRVSHPEPRTSQPGGDLGQGFGLAILARVCDRFEVRRREQRPGTTWVMLFRLEPRLERSSPLRPSRSSLRR